MKETRDILVLFEALNNHEIFTPPKLARQMLELLPNEVWTNPSLKFLDPCTKSGIFLREIFYKLFEGLKNKGVHKGHDGLEYDLNNDQERINHILKNMVYGIATSELTGYVARRTLYGVMEANTDKQFAALESFAKSDNYHQWSEEEQLKFVGRNKFNEYYNHNMFNTKEYKGFEEEGNIFYPAAEVAKKILEDGNYEIEDTYYPFINEETKHQKILDIKESKMKFDVIIGNPPYQISDGGGVGSSAIPIYQKFISIAKELNPRFLTMIIPSRWFSGGRGLDEFRKEMLHDERIQILHDFINASDCFPGVEIKGGVCYFLWNKKHKGNCSITTHAEKTISTSFRPLLEENAETFIRFNEAITILRKIKDKKEDSFAEIISSNDPFGFDVRVKNSYKRVSPNYKKEPFRDSAKFYYNGWRKDGVGYISKDDIRKNNEWVNEFKILIPKAWGTGDSKKDQLNPFIVEPNSCCTETYLIAGMSKEKDIVNNINSYINTKFFHFMTSLIKNTQNAMKKVYSFVPMQNFDESWNDKKLYKKYNLSLKEIEYIELTIPDAARG